MSRKERAVLIVATAGIIVGVIGYAIFSIAGRGPAMPAVGGSWREAIVGQPVYVNPVLARTPADQALVQLIFARVGDLADNIEAIDGGKAVRVHLKEGMHWADGREVTADDIVFTVQKINDPDSGSARAADWKGVRAERVSELEAILRLPAAHAGFVMTVADLRLAPRHLFENVPLANWKISEYMTLPVGNGPYVLISRSVGRDGFISSIELRRNPKFSGADSGPYIEKITVRFAARDEDAISLFNSGAADGVGIPDHRVLDSIQRPYELFRYSSPTVYAIFWNQGANPVLARKDVRRALDLAIDRSKVREAAFGEYGRSVKGPLPAVASSLTDIGGADTEEAKSMLAADGWTAGEDGVLAAKVRGAATKLSFNLLVPDVPFLKAAAEELRSQWLALGVDAKITIVPLEELRNGALKSRSYEAILFGNTLDASYDLYPFWHSSQKFYPGLNLALYNSSAADSSLSVLRGVLADDERVAKRGELEKFIAEGDPALFLFSEEHLYAATHTLKGAGNAVLERSSDRFAEMSRWHVRVTHAKPQ